MTEQELNKRIVEILGSTKTSPDAADVPAANIAAPSVSGTQTIFCFDSAQAGMHQTWGISWGDYEGLRTLLHSGLHIQYMKSSDRQQYLKRRSNRKVRKYFGLSKKGNQYRKVFEYWWTLY